VIMSFFPNQLYKLRTIDPNITTALLVSHDLFSMSCSYGFIQNDVVCWMAPVIDKVSWWLSRYVFRHVVGAGGISVKHTTANMYLDTVHEWQNEGLFINIYHAPNVDKERWLNFGFSVTPDTL